MIISLSICIDVNLLHLRVDCAVFYESWKKKPTTDSQKSAVFVSYLSNLFCANENKYSSIPHVNKSFSHEKESKESMRSKQRVRALPMTRMIIMFAKK